MQALRTIPKKQAHAADDIGVLRTTFNQYIKGVRMLDPAVACKLKDAYNITPDWIYCSDISSLGPEMRVKITRTRD